MTIILTSSEDFSEAELDEGVETVLNSFYSTWEDSTLHVIRFDNKLYQREMANRQLGNSSFSDLDKNNVLIFTVSFTTGNKVEGGLGPNISMDGWQYVLSRENKQSEWKVLTQGV